MNTSYRVALITGAGSGLGRALAVALAAEGTAIAAVDISEEGVRSLADELVENGKSCAWVVADVRDTGRLRSGVAELENKLGAIDLAIANAGIAVETCAAHYATEDVERVIMVNLVGVSNTVGAVLPGMLDRRRGHLVAISSVASVRGFPRMFGYSASKAGVNALMDGLRVELADKGIFVTTVRPGWIRTPLTAKIEDPMPGIMDPDQAAQHVLYAVRRRLRVYTFPRSMVWRMRSITWLPLSWQDRRLAKMFARKEPNEPASGVDADL